MKARIMRFLTVILCLVFLASPIPSDAAEASDDLGELETCLKNVEKSSWLFLVDTSKSLQDLDKDPNDERVAALDELINTIYDRSDALGWELYVELLEFGTWVERPEGLGDFWQPLDDSRKSTVEEVVDDLRDKDNALNTDYLGALKPIHPSSTESDLPNGRRMGVIDLFEKQQKETCQVLVWFSDGELSLEPNFTSSGVKDPITVPNKAARGEAERRLLKELCRTGGPVDQLRGRGGEYLGTREATYVITVGLGTAADEAGGFGVLRAIAERDTDSPMKSDHSPKDPSDASAAMRQSGIDENRCGVKPGLGTFMYGVDFAAVSRLFWEMAGGVPVCGPEQPTKCGEIEDFYIGLGMEYFTVRIEVGPGVNATLEFEESGKPYELQNSGVIERDGWGKITVEPQGNYVLVKAEVPESPSRENWIGRWLVSFSKEHDDNRLGLIVVGSLAPELKSRTLEQGKQPSLVFQLKRGDAAKALEKEDLDDTRLDLDMEVRLRYASDVKEEIYLSEVETSESGWREFEGQKVLASDDGLICETKVRATYDFKDDEEVTLASTDWEECVGEDGESLRELDVLPTPQFPTTCDDGTIPATDAFDASDPGKIIEVEVCFVAGEDGLGNVQFIGAANVDGPAVSVVVVRPEVQQEWEISELGEQIFIKVSLRADEQELMRRFKENDEKRNDRAVVLRLDFTSTSERDEKVDRPYPVFVEVPIQHSGSTQTNWALFFIFTLGSFLLPLLLLYAYNFFWGSRFTKTGPLQRADVDVVVRNGQLFPAQGRNSIVNSEDFGPHAGVRSRSRKFQVTGEVGQVAELAGRMPKLPHNEPWAEGRFQDGIPRYVLSEQGTSKDLTGGRLTPSAAPAWLLGISVVDGETERLSEDWHGRLLVVLPSEPGKHAEASFEELLPQINKALDEHNEAMNEWQNSTNVATEESALDESSGVDLISPPETQLPEMPADEFPKPNNFPEIPD